MQSNEGERFLNHYLHTHPDLSVPEGFEEGPDYPSFTVDRFGGAAGPAREIAA